MKTKLIELGCVVLVLLLLALIAFGCKDEAEANEPNEPAVDYSMFHPIAKSDWEYSHCSECGKKIHITKAHFCVTYLMKHIPTWPDYIELEKELMYFIPDDNDVCTVGDGIESILLPKGTKIYFKEVD